MTFLSNCNLPYSVVENRAIKNFLSILNPKYTLNNRHTMSYRMSPLLYDNLKTVIVESLVRSYHTAKMWPPPRLGGQAMHNTVTFY